LTLLPVVQVVQSVDVFFLDINCYDATKLPAHSDINPPAALITQVVVLLIAALCPTLLPCCRWRS
jgi:hypothetical protein